MGRLGFISPDGIELYVIISKLRYLQVVLQAVKKDFCKICIY